MGKAEKFLQESTNAFVVTACAAFLEHIEKAHSWIVGVQTQHTDGSLVPISTPPKLEDLGDIRLVHFGEGEGNKIGVSFCGKDSDGKLFIVDYMTNGNSMNIIMNYSIKKSLDSAAL